MGDGSDVTVLFAFLLICSLLEACNLEFYYKGATPSIYPEHVP